MSSQLNRFGTDKGVHGALPNQRPTAVDTCPLTKFEGGPQSLQAVEDNARKTNETTVTIALVRYTHEQM